jgi:hypothetical protein
VNLDEVADIAGVVLGETAFGTGPALWVNGKEIAHLDDEDTIDIRVGRTEIRARALPARSKSSDWCEIPTNDIALVRELVDVAAAQHRADPGVTPNPPPSGADLERRRRFHSCERSEP